MNYWLMKNEVEDYSIDDLKKEKTTEWTGVRNYQARNFMRDEMKDGDLAIFYHSNAEPSGCAGLMKIKGQAIADQTQFDKKSDYYDSKANPDNVRWHCRKVEFLEKFPNFVSIQEMRKITACKDMLTLQKGSRLSITPVKKSEWKALLKVAKSRHL